MKKVPISVIITTYNDHSYLEQAVDSVFAQNFMPSEIIIVDDGSNELISDFIIQKYVANSLDIDVFFFRKENGGASSARNFGLNKAKYTYVAFLDVDDKMLPDNLKEKYELIQCLSDDYFGVYGGSIRSTGKEDFYSDFDGCINVELIDEPKIGIPGGSPFYLFNKTSLLEVNGFDEELKCNEDYDILIRLFKNDKKCKGSTSAGFYRNIRPNSLSRPSDPVKHFTQIMSFLDKAERFFFYNKEFLNYRRMAVHLSLVKSVFLKRKYFMAFKFSRKAFEYSKPVTLKQKIIYIFSFSYVRFKK